MYERVSSNILNRFQSFGLIDGRPHSVSLRSTDPDRHTFALSEEKINKK